MAFTSWSDLRTAVKNAIADYVVAGAPVTFKYVIDGREMQYRSIKELEELLDLCDKMEVRDNSGNTSSIVSYGRYRRFR